MKKTVSLLMCAAMLFSFIPKAAFASEIQKQAAKLGIEKGDIVSFAGNGNMPIKWRVIDAYKDNTGKNSDGMLLLSEDTAEKVAVNTISCNDEDSLKKCFKPTYTAFYDKYFADIYRNAVMKTNVTDTITILGTYPNVFRGALTDDTVFAFSISEAKKLGLDERQYDDKNWILRSVRRRIEGINYKNEFAYVNSSDIDSADQNAKITYSQIKDNKNEYYFRPAVNVDKTKLAQLDGKSLLLPAGDYTDAADSLAALGTANEWKLVQKNDNVKITKTDVAVNNNGTYTITVGTDLAAADGDDYISLIIKKSDDSISHYGRYAMTSEESIDLTPPSDFDKENDTVYVFYENYKGALSGSAGEIKEICLHEYDCTSVDDNTHKFTCKKCGYSKDEEHNLTLIETQDDYHALRCADCEKIITENHKYTATEQTDDQHTLKCTVCENTKTENHTYGKITDAAVQENVSCTGCGKQKPFMVRRVNFSAVPEFNGKKFAARTEYDANSVKFPSCYVKNKNIFDTEIRTELSAYSAGAKMTATFNTTTPIRAIGFRIKTYTFNNLPNNIILYGKNDSSDDYKKIGSAFLKPLLSANDYRNSDTYNFLFTDATNFAAYNSFKIEMDNDINSVGFFYFGLLSDKGASFTVSADGAVADGTQSKYAYPGEDFVLTLLSKGGHPSSSDIAFTTDGETAAEDIWTYSEDTGIFTLYGAKISSEKTYALNINCADKSINVDIEPNNATLIKRDENPEFGKDFSCVFGDRNKETEYAPTKRDIEVLCGGDDITEYCEYADCTLKIPGRYVRGNIKITASEKYGIQKKTSQVKIERPDKPERWYNNDELDVDAMLADISASGDRTITLFKGDRYNVTIKNALPFASGNITLDLNQVAMVGYSEVSVGEGANLTIKNGISSTIDYIVGAKSIMTLENVSMNGGALNAKGKLIVNNTGGQEIEKTVLKQGSEFVLKNGKIDSIKLYQPKSIKLYSGTIGNISSYADESEKEQTKIDYNGLLGDGCEFYNIKSQEAFDKGEPTGFSVRCLHKNVDAKTGLCELCDKYIAVIMTENDGAVNYFKDILAAAGYANQNANTTIKLLGDVIINDASVADEPYIQFCGENTTLDLNGKDFGINGENDIISVTGSLTVTGNGLLAAQLDAESGSTLVIENGVFRGVSITSKKVTLYGGDFDKIIIKNGLPLGDFIGEGKACKSSVSGAFDKGYELRTGEIIGVEVADKTFVITDQPKGKYIEKGSQNEKISVGVKANKGYEDKTITYQWYVYTVTSENSVSEPTIAGTDAVCNIDTTGFENGVHRVYCCQISCEGYSEKTEYAMFTIGTGKPTVSAEFQGNRFVDAKGNDCVLIAAAYSGKRLLGTKFKELTKESGFLKLDDILPLSEIVPEKKRNNVSEIKLFFWDNINDMYPLSDVTSISNN